MFGNRPLLNTGVFPFELHAFHLQFMTRTYLLSLLTSILGTVAAFAGLPGVLSALSSARQRRLKPKPARQPESLARPAPGCDL